MGTNFLYLEIEFTYSLFSEHSTLHTHTLYRKSPHLSPGEYQYRPCERCLGAVSTPTIQV